MYNRAILIGRLCADPEMRTTPEGTNVTTIRLAVNRAHNRDKADFIAVVAWRNTAEFICNYFKKGSAIGVEGVIQTREYTDKEGVKRTAFEVVADRAFFVESKKKDDAPKSDGFADADFDDMPF
jgi:single-strand DNA-binding protein